MSCLTGAASIAFASEAQTLVPGRDRNGFLMDVFVRATSDASTLRRVSLAPSGAQANSYSTDPALSADGRWIAFRSSASNLTERNRNQAPDIFVRGPLR
ncbi:MAG: hypothetical protein HOQ03_00875 [Thermoleophilia bacterium]|nr:hypothetical protein [Thermoleophilia bacterium]